MSAANKRATVARLPRRPAQHAQPADAGPVHLGNFAPAEAAPPGAAEATAARLVKLGQRLDITLPADAEEAWERATDEYDRATRAMVRAGVYFLWLKERLPHGEFQAGVEARDIEPRRAREAMRVARWLMQLAAPAGSKRRPSAVLKKVLDIGPQKLLALSRVSPEVFDNSADFDLTAVDCMSVRMLKKHLNKYQEKSENLFKQAEHWKSQAHTLMTATGAERAGSERPASVSRARSEGAALADQALAHIGALAHQADALLRADDLGADRAERTANLAAAAQPLALHIGAVASAALLALESMRETLGDYLPARWDAEHQPEPVSEALAHELGRWRAVHVRKMAAEAVDRENARVARGEVKRGRGRPAANPLKDLMAQLAPPKRRPGRPRKETKI